MPRSTAGQASRKSSRVGHRRVIFWVVTDPVSPSEPLHPVPKSVHRVSRQKPALFGVLGIGAGGFIGSLITAFVGAVVLILLLRAIRRV